MCNWTAERTTNREGKPVITLTREGDGYKVERNIDMWQISELMYVNRVTGRHFFEPASMRFFSSRVMDRVYAGCVFITSEKHDAYPRLYTVRRLLDDGSVETIGEFQAYRTSKAAHSAALAYSRQFDV